MTFIASVVRTANIAQMKNDLGFMQYFLRKLENYYVVKMKGWTSLFKKNSSCHFS